MAAPFTGVGRWIGITSLVLTLAYAAAVTVAAHPARTEPHPLRYRALVGLLYLAQPIVRTWGRVFYGGSVETPPQPLAPAPWTGERIHWLRKLENGLRQRGLSVRIGGPHDHWDLEASLGFTIAERMTVAVVWGWTPVSRLRMRPRAPALVGAGVLSVAAALGSVWSLPLLGGLAGFAFIEAAIVRRRTAAVMKLTTNGSSGDG